MKTTGIYYSLMTVLLRAALLVALVGAGWMIYSHLPQSSKEDEPATRGETMLQIVLRPSAGNQAGALDIALELYPIDIVAARHEYFTERRAGKRFDDFLSERMKGRSPVAARLDRSGQTFVSVPAGSWWLHALLSGDEELEWRLPITVAGRKQTVQLTSQNVYTRTRSF
ncbi:MAG: hypothetical protein M3539_15955 [Acidobacteriota bacterium]|nr:hypothetical protein [Acidobacteriota bacterium]